MPTYAYIARSTAGERVDGTLESASEQTALSELQSRGLAPVRVNETTTRKRTRRVSIRRLSAAYRQLADLLRAGVPLMRALRLLGNSKSDPALAAVMTEIADAIAEGDRLADAMARHPSIFPPVQIAMIRAGERGSFLDSVLARLAQFLEHQADLRSKVIGALIYPFVLIFVGLAIVVGALVVFVPKFADFYAGTDVPTPTRILLGASNVLTQHWLAAMVGTAIATFVALWALRKPAVRRQLAIMQLRIPKFGTLVRSLAVARFSRILGTMLGNGIPMLVAMRISRDAAGHPLLEEAIDAATEAVRSGEPLAAPLRESGLFDEDVVEMVAVGESANNLADVLISIAETLESRIDRLLAIALRLLEPLLLLILAGAVLFIFVALVVPMLRMSSAL